MTVSKVQIVKYITDAEVAEIKRNMVEARASLACEGIYLTDEEEALFQQFNDQRLPHEERRRRLLEYCLKKAAEEQLDAAE